MTEFKRAEPKPMPDNWEELGRQYNNESLAFTSLARSNPDKYDAVDDPRKLKREGGVDVAIVAKNTTVYSIFETAIRCEKFLDIVRFFMDQDERSYPPEDEDKRYKAGPVKGAFLCFWVKEHIGLPVYLLDNARGIYGHASGAVWAYLRGQEIEWCYMLMDDSIEFQLNRSNLAVSESIIKSVERV